MERSNETKKEIYIFRQHQEKKLPSIPDYFSGKNVFLTGATGFCGKPIVEKLLRSCPQIGGIYCLMRGKDGSSAQQRVQNMFDDPVRKSGHNIS